MKKIFILMFMAILLVGTVAAWEFDNIKTYDKETQTIDIRNSILGIPFLQLDKIAEIKLDTPLVNYVIRGPDRLVAEFTIESFTDYTEGTFDDLQFYNIQKGMKQFDRDFVYKYKDYYDIEVKDYQTICKEKEIIQNGTIVIEKYDCYKSQIGTHLEKGFNWIILNHKLDLPKGIITIGIFTDVLVNDKVEWIPTLFGVRISEFAEWTESMNVDLTHYWNFTNNADDLIGDSDGTVNGATLTGATGCKLGGCYQYDGGDYIQIDTSNDLVLGQDFTVNCWVNSTTVGNGAYLMILSLTQYYWEFAAVGVPTGNFSVIMANATHDAAGITVVDSNAAGIDDGNFHMVTWLRPADSNVSRIYFDGVNTANSSADFDGVGNDGRFGSREATSYWNGNIDDCAIWERDLSDAEVSQLWNSGNGIEYTDVFPISVLQSFPIDNIETTDNTVGLGCNFSSTSGENITDVTVLVYDSSDNLDYTNTESGLVLTSYNKTWTTSALIDDTYSWACLGEGTTTEGYAGNRTFIVNTTPRIQFESPTPVNFYNSTSSSFVINVSLAETYFQNVTFNIYNSTTNLISSNTFTTSTRDYTFTSTYDDTYNYSVIVATTTGQSNTTETRTINIDTIIPVINITYPTDLIDYHVSGDNLTLNWSVSDTHLESCWYNYNSTNISVTCSDNSTQFIVTENSSKNLTFYANDSFGNEDSNFISWNIKVIEINQTYNNETTEGSLETFLASIRLGDGFSITNVLINYNNSFNAGQSFANGEDTILRKADFLIPSVDIDTNISFYWDITLSDSTHINLTSQNQTVYNLNLDDCSVFTNELLNFTVINEEKQILLPNATIEISVNVYDGSRTVQIMNFSNLYEKVNPLRICLNRNLTANTSYSLDSIVRYEDVGFANEYYNIINHQLTSETTSQKIILYDLNISDSTEFQLTFTGADFLTIENALIYVNRQYISENIFKTVELPKTDFNGQTILHLVRNDVIYNIRIIKDGEVLGSFENIVAFCDDFTIGDCNIELNAFDSVENIFSYDTELGIIFNVPEYNETTNEVTFNFITSDGSVKTVRLEVSRNDIFGNRSICNDSLTSSGGTLTCDVDPNIDESILKAKIYVDELLTVSSNVKIDTTNYGVAGYLIMFIMALSFIFMFSGSKTGILISIVVTLAGSIGLGLVSGNLIGIGASGLWLLVIVSIGIYKLNARRNS